MGYREKLIVAAKRRNCTVTEDTNGLTFEVRVEANQGLAWADEEIHEMVTSGYEGTGAKEAVRKQAYNRLTTTPPPQTCLIPDCEWCADNR